MNFEKVQRKNRKAISPVLATVILIAITLIAAIAIAGFVFGLFGSFTSSATVSASTVNCTAAVTGNCVVMLQNTGTSNATPTSCSETFAGTSHPGAVSPAAAVVAGAAPVAYTCTLTTPTPANVGSAVTGSFTMSNSGVVSFVGLFS